MEEKRQKLALVVGNNFYPEPFRTLSNAVEDAAVVAGFLKRRLRFEVTSLYNKTASEVGKALSALVKKLRDDSQFFFYFAGHGLCVGASRDQSLLCADASELLLDGVVSAPGALSPDALETISRNGRGDMFIVLDVCRTQTLRQMGGPEIQRGGAGLRDAINRPNGEGRGRRLTLSSCKDGQGANDDGVFANALVEEMERLLDGGYELKLGDDLVEAVSKHLKYGQTPVLSGERFVLVPGTPATVARLGGGVHGVPSPPPSSPPKTALQLTTEANAALQAGRYEEAERLANEALRIDSSFGWSTHVLTEARKKLEERREKERRSLELDQTLNEGWICHNNGDVKLALAKATAVLKERPNAPAALELKRVAEAAIWSPSPSRAAGYRQTLQIGSQEYGFCWIPAGEFDMGSPTSEKGRFGNEKLHHVKLTKGFWALETPTPQSLYQEVMGTNPSKFKGDDLPVETVSWADATKFCAELTKRLPQGLRATLPTEAQWEYACRAGTKTPYSFGSVLNGEKANCNGNHPYGTRTKGKYVEKTTPVKTYDPNAWGLYDMHGNVYECCLDYFRDYPTGTAIDPKGPASASYRVIRGGCWRSFAWSCRSAYRLRNSADFRSYYLGFRFLLVYD